MRSKSLKNYFQTVFHILPWMAFVLFTFLPQLALAGDCTGSNAWWNPRAPSASHPVFGSYNKNIAKYSSSLCDGDATKNAITGNYQQYPTSVMSDGFNERVDNTPDATGPRHIAVSGQAAGRGFQGTTNLDKAGNAGGWTNKNYIQDTLTCVHPGATSTQTSDINIKLDYRYTTIASGNVSHYLTDAESSVAITHSSGDSDNWDSGNKISHISPNNPDVQSKEGHLTIKGDTATFYISMYYYTKGTQFIPTGSTSVKRQGTLDTSFEITGYEDPTNVSCTSASGAFPGADGPSKDQVDKEKEADRIKKLCEDFIRDKKPEDANSQTGEGGFADVTVPPAEVGNPINFARGFKVQREVDYTGSMGLNFTRTYRSNGDWLDYNLGKYWRHNFNRTLDIDTSVTPAIATITNGEGVVTAYREVSSNTWEPFDFEIMATFEAILSGPTVIGYRYTRPDNTKEFYDTSGKLTRIEYVGSFAVNLTYDGSNRLDEVEDESGRKIEFNYDGSDRISSIVTPDGTYSYTYDANNNLTKVTKPDTKTRLYHYENVTFLNVLTGVTNEESVRISTWGYDAQGRPVSSENAGGVNDFTVVYNTDDTVTVTNPLGKQTTYTFQTFNGVRKIVDIEGHASTNCPAGGRTFDYTVQGWVSEMTDWEGNTTTYDYDSRGLQTSRTEALGATEERTITTTWDSTFRLPNVITRTGKTTDYDYDSDGRLTKITITDTGTSETRIWTYTYHSNTTDGSGNTILGRLKEINGPRTDVTDKVTYAYDVNFNLTKITNALSQEIEITARDSAGRPTTIEDVNNVETDLTYDSNERLKTITIAPGTSLEAVTTLTYSDAGDITEIEVPNGTAITYTYDNVRRLTGVEDDMGNTITYTIDDAGNTTKEERKNSGLSLKYTYTQAFDELSRVIKLTGADTQEWEYEYDKNSNLTKFTDANNNATDYAYDALQRLLDSNDALSGVTELTWNDLDQLDDVEDPRNNNTEYTNTAFGDVTEIDSLDTGSTTFTYDKGGNATKMTDDRSVVSDYTYDALNRLLTIKFPSDGSLDVTFSYDDNPGTTGACGTSVGRLCRVVDASGTTDYKYNDLGQLTQIKEVRGSLTFTTEYEYDLAGLVTKSTLPSGREVDYSRNANGQVSGVSADVSSTATTLSSSMTYLPFGPLTSMTYGNTLALTNVYDQDYLLTSRSVNTVFTHTYDHDANGNITQKGSWTYDYDALNRMDEQDDSSTTTSFTYDAIANRLTENDGSSTTYTYPSTSSKLSSVGSNSYTYDAAGNIADDGTLKYTWDAANRLKEVKDSSTSSLLGSYVYNVSNLRVEKTVSSVTTHFVYGSDGLLLGEYDSSGNMIREYVYSENEPLAQIDSGSPEILTYLHTDHIDTPRYATNTSGSTVWTWDSGAFGKETPTGTATVNLRFPGQYYDGESGLHYNWNRYYNPQTGRYVSSDPIGLKGGLNTFGYVEQNPINSSDLSGLGGCYVDFQGYMITIPGTDYQVPIGHAGVLIYDEETGVTEYYEFGRYGTNKGRVRPQDVPDLKLDENGNIPNSEWFKLRKWLENHLGKGSKVELKCNNSLDEDAIEDFAKNWKEEYDWSPWKANTCKGFAWKALKAGLANRKSGKIELE